MNSEKIYFLVESPMGLSIVDESNAVNSVLRYSTPEQAVQAIRSIESLNFIETVENFFKSFKKTRLVVSTNKLADFLTEKYNLEVTVDLYEVKCRHSYKYFIDSDNSKENSSITDFNSFIYQFSHLFTSSDIHIDDTRSLFQTIEKLEISINKRTCRVREWYSLHFPELVQEFDGSCGYSQVDFLQKVKEVGHLTDAEKRFGEKQKDQVEEANKRSKKTEDEKSGKNEEETQRILDLISTTIGTRTFSEDEISFIVKDADEIIETIKLKEKLEEFLDISTKHSLPNTYDLLLDTKLIVKFINKAGSISKLGMMPGSTLQILGAEQSYVKAVAEKKGTPKHGYIFLSNLVLQTSTAQSKGKVSRSLASKMSICLKTDFGLLTKEEKSSEVTLSVGKKARNYIKQLIARYNTEKSKKLGKRASATSESGVKKKGKVISVIDFFSNNKK